MLYSVYCLQEIGLHCFLFTGNYFTLFTVYRTSLYTVYCLQEIVICYLLFKDSFYTLFTVYIKLLYAVYCLQEIAIHCLMFTGSCYTLFTVYRKLLYTVYRKLFYTVYCLQEIVIHCFYRKLDGTARYRGLLLAPAESFGQGFFCPSGKKRAFNGVCVDFRPFLVFSSNLRNV